ncbi:tyrosine-type recombinase/integrase [Azospirillum brasilense]|nr:tyrosine-type recombinase/integrase [Azospirillum brasilense]
MARQLIETKIDTRTARAKLAPRPHQPYWRGIGPGLHLGYRKGKTGGKWCVRWSVGSGDAKIETFGSADDNAPADGVKFLTYAQAVAMAHDVHAAASQPAPEPAAPEAPAAVTVQDACERYIAHLRAQGQKTWLDAERRLKRYVAPDMKELQPRQRKQIKLDGDVRTLILLGNRPVNDLSLSDLEAWRNALIRQEAGSDGARASMDTANRIISYLKAALNRLMLDPRNGVASDLAWRFLKPFKDVGVARHVHLDQAQVARLLKVTDGTLRRLIAGLLLTGARPPNGELAQVRVRDFMPATSTVHISDSKTGPRSVVLTEEGVRFFRGAVQGLAPDDLIFTRDDGLPWEKQYFRRALLRAVKAANADQKVSIKLPPGTCPYSLRHTHASQALANGMNLQLLAENMGTSVRMLEQNYGKFIQATRRALIEASAPKLGL